MDEDKTPNIVEESEISEEKHPGGRPSSISDITIAKLIGAFQQGLNVKNACNYAGISTDAYYRRFNSDEQFRNQIEQSKLFLVAIASDTLLRAMVNPDTPLAVKVRLAMWYLERKEPESFGKNPKNEGDWAIEPDSNPKKDLVPMEYPDFAPLPFPTLEPLK